MSRRFLQGDQLFLSLLEVLKWRHFRIKSYLTNGIKNIKLVFIQSIIVDITYSIHLASVSIYFKTFATWLTGETQVCMGAAEVSIESIVFPLSTFEIFIYFFNYMQNREEMLPIFSGWILRRLCPVNKHVVYCLSYCILLS